MPTHIQRDYLRRLLRAVANGDRTPEHASDIIIELINDNYELKSDEELIEQQNSQAFDDLDHY